MGEARVIVIGAGVGGLTAATLLAAQGCAVTVIEKAPASGGKMREIVIDGAGIDAGPTVFTMRWVFDAIFADAGTSLDAHLTLIPVDRLARHAWGSGGRLDLFADLAASEAAIGDFAGAANARGFRSFCVEAARAYNTLERPFLRSGRTGPVGLAGRVGANRPADLLNIHPFSTLWRALGTHFSDPRLQQLFGRYATYSGSSPYLAPATLMLIAHVESEGVWVVAGGMHRVARALESVATGHGARFRYNADVAEIRVGAGGATGVRLASDEVIDADHVIVNADPSAVADGHFGDAARGAVAVTPRGKRSLSALTFTLAATTRNFELLRHNVFFADDYANEFSDIFARHRLPATPSVYVCAQDRDAGHAVPDRERLHMIINAPATGDSHAFTPEEIQSCATQTFALLARCGLDVERRNHATVATTPTDFNQRFPATGGALYGRASHGWAASFQRPGAITRIPGLYLAGGATHPGAGVPMAALSGRQAAMAVLDRSSTARSAPRAMRGGMSTR
jgi:1-hydroxycarotenoid 3,4-desaturase